MNILQYNELLKVPNTGFVRVDLDGKITVTIGAYSVVWDKNNPRKLSYFSIKRIKKIRSDKIGIYTRVYRDLAELAEPYLLGKHSGNFVSFSFGEKKVNMQVFHNYIIPMSTFEAISLRFARIEKMVNPTNLTPGSVQKVDVHSPIFRSDEDNPDEWDEDNEVEVQDEPDGN